MRAYTCAWWLWAWVKVQSDGLRRVLEGPVAQILAFPSTQRGNGKSNSN